MSTLEHDPARPGQDPARVHLEAQESEEFQRLRRTFRGFAFPMTAAFLAWYLLYVLANSYAPGLMRVRVAGQINLALVLGVAQFVTTFGIAWLYARHANRRLDPLAEQVRNRVEEELR